MADKPDMVGFGGGRDPGHVAEQPGDGLGGVADIVPTVVNN